MYKDFFVLEVDGVAIVGQIFLPDKTAKYPAVCLCHGVPSGNTPEPGDGGYPVLAEQICHEGFAVFIFNFRGTGDSGGNLDILGWTHDLDAVVDHLWGLPGREWPDLFLVGFSAGAAVSICVASHDQRVSGVVACASPADFSFFTGVEKPQASVERYRSIGAIRDTDFPKSIEDWINGFRLVTPVDHVAEIAPRPLLLIHGTLDETVNISHAHKLYEAAREPKELVVLDGAGHKLRRDDRAIDAVMEWLKSRK